MELQRPELTEEQLETYKQLHEDVKAYAQKRAAELGFELPENGFFRGRGMGFRGFRRGCGLRSCLEGKYQEDISQLFSFLDLTQLLFDAKKTVDFNEHTT